MWASGFILSFQIQATLHEFNLFSTHITEALWYLDSENKFKFFITFSYGNRSAPFSPMHVAASAGKVEAVQFYLENLNRDKNPGVQIEGNLKGRGPMHLAAEAGKLEVVQLMKQHLGLVNPSDSQGMSVLHIATYCGHIEIVKEICKDLDEKDPIAGEIYEHNTPLHLAALEGHFEIVKYLHEIGSDLFIKNKNGFTAYELAQQKDHKSIVAYLISLSINKAAQCGDLTEVRKLFNDLDKQNQFDPKLFIETSPLHEAAKGGHMSVLDFFGNKIPNMSIIDSNGMTALHHAAKERQLQAVQYLADFIDIDITNYDGKTACDIAKSADFKSIYEYLEWFKMKPVPHTPVSDGATPSFQKLEIEADAECPICCEPLKEENWGLLHSGTIHSGYCEKCLKTLKKDGMNCPECRAVIEAVVKVH